MLFTKKWVRPGAAVLLALAAGAVQAHPGHGEEGVVAGLVHPFMGVDHLLAMVAVGIWSCTGLPRAQRMAGPLVFLTMLAVGALVAPDVNVSIEGVELGVALSVLLLGVLLMWGRKLGSVVGLLVVGAAALLHGVAHGNDLMTGEPEMRMIAGMLLGSALLHGAGYLVGTQVLHAPRWVQRVMAAALGLSGLVLMATRL